MAKFSNIEDIKFALDAQEADAGLLNFVEYHGESGKRFLLEVAMDSKCKFSPQQRGRSIHILGILRWRKGFSELLNLLNHNEASLRINAMYALSRVNGYQSAAPLLEILEDSKRDVTDRSHALRALSENHNAEVLHRIECQYEIERRTDMKILMSEVIGQLRER